jgi:hypothetical protein
MLRAMGSWTYTGGEGDVTAYELHLASWHLVCLLTLHPSTLMLLLLPQALQDNLGSKNKTHFKTDPKWRGEFFVTHYAGPVNYAVRTG